MTDSDLGTLLGAYLDGELTASQTERLERRLAKDPAARWLLEQLSQVRQVVGSLPRTKAPQDMAERIEYELERDVLLAPGDVRSEIAGRNHLRLRRFVASAAVLMLVAAVAAIVYSVLGRPDRPGISAERMTEIMAIAAAEYGTSGDIGPDAVDAALASDLSAPVVDVPQRSSLELVIDVGYDPFGYAGIENLLAEGGIDQVLASPLDQNRRQFAFVCTSDQVRRLCRQIKVTLGSSVDLIVTDRTTNCQLLVSDASESQIMAIAAEPDSIEQFAQALKFQPALADWFTRPHLPDGQSQLPNLRLLAPIDGMEPTPGSPLVPLNGRRGRISRGQPGRGASPEAPAPAPAPALVAVTLIVRTQPPQSPQPTEPSAPIDNGSSVEAIGSITTIETGDASYSTYGPITATAVEPNSE